MPFLHRYYLSIIWVLQLMNSNRKVKKQIDSIVSLTSLTPPLTMPVSVVELVRPFVHQSKLMPQDVVYWWFEAQRGTSRKVFILGYSCTQSFPL